MNSDFETSRWGQQKGCRCHDCGHNLKMVHNPCCVSITTVTCLRLRLSKWGRTRERDVATEGSFLQLTIPTHDKTRRDWLPLRWQLGIALVTGQARTSASGTFWLPQCDETVDGAAGLQHYNTTQSCSLIHLSFLSLCTCPCGRNIYGLLKSTRDRELTNIVSRFCQKSPKFASLHFILWGQFKPSAHS